MNLLAFDTSTEQLEIALTDGYQHWQQSSPGGAAASSTLLPAILALLADAGRDGVDNLDAIVFGCGPGAFSGLRTACSVAQGLAFGARGGQGLPVLPVGTLLAVAEDARFQLDPLGARSTEWAITAVLDARMGEVYSQTFRCTAHRLEPTSACRLSAPDRIDLPEPASVLAGNAWAQYEAQWPSAWHKGTRLAARPTALALLRLAPALIAAGGLVDAALALPLYVRDKVAQTTAERLLAKISPP